MFNVCQHDLCPHRAYNLMGRKRELNNYKIRISLMKAHGEESSKKGIKYQDLKQHNVVGERMPAYSPLIPHTTSKNKE